MAGVGHFHRVRNVMNDIELRDVPVQDSFPGQMTRVTALLSSAAFVVMACTGDGDRPADSTALSDTSETVSREWVPSTDPVAGAVERGPSPERSVGTAHGVQMIGDASGYRFEPSELTVSEGDAVRFTAAGGGPHNVVFEGGNLSSETQTRLDRNLSERSGPLATVLLSEPGETVTVSFAGLPSGTYRYSCATHAELGMRGSIILL